MSGGAGALLFFLLLIGEAENPEEVIVAKVIDGDTIQIADGRLIRYLGVDTPELRRRVGEEWVYDPEPFAEEATLFNRDLVEGKKVRIEYDATREDRFGRVLAYVYREGIFVNAELIKEGYARVLVRIPPFQFRSLFLRLQQKAREEKKGIWG